jgi:hypothetical protein
VKLGLKAVSRQNQRECFITSGCFQVGLQLYVFALLAFDTKRRIEKTTWDGGGWGRKFELLVGREVKN